MSRPPSQRSYGEELSLVGVSATARLAASVVSLLATVVTTSLVVRLLGTRDYGILAFLMSAVTLIPDIASLGFATAAARTLADAESRANRERLERTLRAGMTIALVSGAIGAVAMILLAQVLPRGLDGSTRLVAGASLGLMLFGINVSTMSASMGRALGRVVASEVPSTIFAVARAAVVVALTIAGVADIRAVVVGYAGAGVVAAIVGTSVVRSAFRSTVSILRPSPAAARALAVFSVPFAVWALSHLVIDRFDVLVLGIARSSAAVGQYEPSMKITAQLTVIAPLLFGAQFVPTATRLLAQGDRASFGDLFARITKLTFVAGMVPVILLAAFPETALRALYGSEYPVRPGVIWVLLLGYTATTAFAFNGLMLAAMADAASLRWVGGIALVAMLLFAAVLVPAAGIMGAAIATSASLLVLSLASGLRLRTVAGFGLLRRDHTIALASAVLPVAAGLAVRVSGPPDGLGLAAVWTFLFWGLWVALLFAVGTLRWGEIEPLLGVFRREPDPPRSNTGS